MKNVSHKKRWKLGMTQAHVEPLPITFMMGTYDGKSYKYFIILKLHRYHMSSTPDLYEFMMSLVGNGEPETFLLFVCNFNMNFVATGILETGAKIQYIHTLVCGEASHHFDLLYIDV